MKHLLFACVGAVFPLMATSAQTQQKQVTPGSASPSRLSAEIERSSGTAYDGLPLGAKIVLEAYPKTRAMTVDGRVAAFYAAPMTSAPTAEQAVGDWLDFHSGAFGVDNLDLRLAWAADTGNATGRGLAPGIRKFSVFAYQQYLDGLPVEYAIGRFLVLNGDSCHVTYAAATVASPPDGGFQPDKYDGELAIASIMLNPLYAHLEEWSEPEMVVFAGNPVETGQMIWGTFPAIRAWKFTGERITPESLEKYCFFVNAADATLWYVRNEVMRMTDVTGNVQGYATPGTLPDTPSNPPVLTPLPDLFVRIDGGHYALTDENGEFLITHEGTAPVTVRTALDDGNRVRVVDSQNGNVLSLEMNVAPPGPANFDFNVMPTNVSTGHVNAFLHATLTYEFFRLRSTWTGLDPPLLILVERAPCDGFFAGEGIYLGSQGSNGVDTCVNSAFSSYITHEYGHFVVNQLMLGQSPGSFGEGFADALSVLRLDDPVHGRDYGNYPLLPRDYSEPERDRTYPCQIGSPNCTLAPGIIEDEQYCCGRILAGLWRDIRVELGNAHGQAVGLETARELFVAWALITSGGYANESAHPLTIAEILAVDYDGNGTPNCEQICEAASAHDLLCADPCGPPPALPPAGPLLSFRTPITLRLADDGITTGADDPTGIAVGRINNDSLDDVVLACPQSNSLVIYFGESSSTTSYSFVRPPTVIPLGADTRPIRVAIGDMSLSSSLPDAHHDIVVTLQESHAVQILLNDSNGSGTFNPSDPNRSRIEYFTGVNQVCYPIGLVVADFDGNNRGDVAIAGLQSANCGAANRRPALGLLFKNTTGTGFRFDVKQLDDHLPGNDTSQDRGYDLRYFVNLPNSGPDAPSPLGYQRLVMTNQDQARLFILRYATYPPTFTPMGQGQFFDAIPSMAAAIGDIDGDGWLDITCASSIAGQPIRWLRQSPPNFWALDPGQFLLPQQPTPQAALAIECGLLSKVGNTTPASIDYLPDIVAAIGIQDDFDPLEFEDFRFPIFGNTGLTGHDRFQAAREFAPTSSPNDRPFAAYVIVHDVNGDARPDILMSLRGTPLQDDLWEGFSLILNR